MSGSDELAHPVFADALDPMLRSIVDAVRTDPASAQEGFASMHADVMWSMVVDMSGDGDRAIYTAPAFARAFRRALDEGFAQGAEGYSRAALLAMAPWPFDVARSAGCYSRGGYGFRKKSGANPAEAPWTERSVNAPASSR